MLLNLLFFILVLLLWFLRTFPLNDLECIKWITEAACVLRDDALLDLKIVHDVDTSMVTFLLLFCRRIHPRLRRVLMDVFMIAVELLLSVVVPDFVAVPSLDVAASLMALLPGAFADFGAFGGVLGMLASWTALLMALLPGALAWEGALGGALAVLASLTALLACAFVLVALLERAFGGAFAMLASLMDFFEGW